MSKIIEIIKEINPYVEVDYNSQLLTEGILDSLGIMYLVTSLEGTYDIDIKGENIVPEYFKDIMAIEELIRISGGVL